MQFPPRYFGSTWLIEFCRYRLTEAGWRGRGRCAGAGVGGGGKGGQHFWVQVETPDLEL